MKKFLYGVTPIQSHGLAGRVVSILRKAGITERSTLNRVHEIVETRSYDPQGLKVFLRNFVDMVTAPAPPPPVIRDQRVQYEEDRNAVLSGDTITGMFEFESEPATDLGEKFSLPTYEVEESEWVND